jgi:hypothetical protein
MLTTFQSSLSAGDRGVPRLRRAGGSTDPTLHHALYLVSLGGHLYDALAMHLPALEWALSRLVIEPLARHAAALLSDAGLHGHKYAIDAILSATAWPPPDRSRS